MKINYTMEKLPIHERFEYYRIIDKFLDLKWCIMSEKLTNVEPGDIVKTRDGCTALIERVDLFPYRAIQRIGDDFVFINKSELADELYNIGVVQTDGKQIIQCLFKAYYSNNSDWCYCCIAPEEITIYQNDPDAYNFRETKNGTELNPRKNCMTEIKYNIEKVEWSRWYERLDVITIQTTGFLTNILNKINVRRMLNGVSYLVREALA